MTEVTQVSGMSGYQGQEAVLSTDEAGQMTMAGVQNAKHADSDGASRKARSPYPIADDEDINIDDYEMVDPEFFAQIKEAAFTVNVDKTTANAASVRMLPNAEYVKYMINRKEKRLILKPCSEYDIRGFRWAREKNGRRYAAPRTGRIFVLFICSVMGWNPDNRYKIMGKKSRAKGEEVLVFDLSVAKCYEKTAGKEKSADAQASSILAGWDGKFGPTYGEDKRSLQIDTFDGYTIFSLNDQKKPKKDREIEEVPVTAEGDLAGKNDTAEIIPQSNSAQDETSPAGTSPTATFPASEAVSVSSEVRSLDVQSTPVSDAEHKTYAMSSASDGDASGNHAPVLSTQAPGTQVSQTEPHQTEAERVSSSPGVFR
ncbi:MAG: hypothetical protein J6M66_05180 [Lachnospiraceae bacterium]|nr:hypothetical protein [Lachnospiraceae bacterium]